MLLSQIALNRRAIMLAVALASLVLMALGAGDVAAASGGGDFPR